MVEEVLKQEELNLLEIGVTNSTLELYSIKYYLNS